MTGASGRVRPGTRTGWTKLLDGVFPNLDFGVLKLEPTGTHCFETGDREYGCVLVYGDCTVSAADGSSFRMGPRENPFDQPPFGVLFSRKHRFEIRADADSLIGIGIAPAPEAYPTCYLAPPDVREVERGAENWSRRVRYLFWPDNSEGNQLLMGETIIPSGNWGTIPPHRHDEYIESEEVPYNEAYFFNFSKPRGFGLLWQSNESGTLDETFSIRTGDVAYMGEGYHPVVCGPGADLYQLTIMAGPHRVSRARLHPDYASLTRELNMADPYTNQR